MKSYFLLFIVIFCSSDFSFAQQPALRLEDGIARALQNNPALLASQLEVQAREARISQANALPNPEFLLFTEDIGGSGQFEGFDKSQTTAQISQRLELGGKRGARREAATRSRDVAQAEVEIRRREVASTVRRAFFTVLINQERVKWMNELLNVSNRFSSAVIDRIAAGKIPPIDEVKARSIVSLAQIDLDRAKRELESARYQLAATMGEETPEFTTVQGEFASPADFTLEQLLQLLPVSAELKRAELEIEQSKAVLDLEKSKGVPDLTVSGGYRRLQTTDDSAFVAGVNLPLPFFDRNRGGIEEAQNRVSKTEQMKASVVLDLRNSLTRSYHSYTAAKSEADALRTNVVPANETSFNAISEGYTLGKYGLLDVLEAQRSMFQARLQLLRALEDIYASAAELERITGKEILTLQSAINGGKQ